MKKLSLGLVLLALCGLADAQTYTKFGPATGVLVGTTTSPQTTAATIANLQPILSTTPGLVLNGATGGTKGAGTINATGLYVNGSPVGVGGGAVSSVGLTAPTCFGVTGSPITSAGSLGLTLTGTIGQFVQGDGTCSNTLAAAAPTQGLLLKDTGAATNAKIANIVSTGGFFSITGVTDAGVNGTNLFVGTRNGSGWSAVAIGNSTDKPAITLNGPVTIPAPPASGIAFNATGAANTYTAQFTGSTTTGQSFGVRIAAGTNASDAALGIANSAATATLGAVFGNGSFQWGWNGTAATLSGTGTGNVTIPAPSSGVALTAIGVASGTIASFEGTGTNGNYLAIKDDTTGITRGFFGYGAHTIAGASIADLGIAAGTSGNFLIGTANGAAIGTTFGPNGNVVIGPAASGIDLIATAVTGTNIGLVIAGTGSSAPTISSGLLFASTGTGTTSWRINQPGTVSWDFINTGTTGVLCITASLCTTGLTITPNGNVVIPASASGIPLSITGVANGNTALFTGASTSGQSYGPEILAGTTTADIAFRVLNQVGSANYFYIFGDGGNQIGSPLGGDKGIGSLNTQTLYVNGQPNDRVCAYKNTQTTRTSTTTPAADPDLQVTLALGTYVMDLWIELVGQTTGTQGFQWNFGGTSFAVNSGYGTNGFVNNTGYAHQEVSGLGTTVPLATIDSTSSAINDWIKVTGVAQVTTAGTFTFNWSQASSSANGTTVLSASYFCMNRIL